MRLNEGEGEGGRRWKEGGRKEGRAGDEGGGFMQAVSVGVGLPEGADRGRGRFVTILHRIL